MTALDALSALLIAENFMAGFEDDEAGQPGVSDKLAKIRDAIAALSLTEGVQSIVEIAAERHRQIAVEGWTPEHDDQHSDFSLAKAASVYAAAAAVGAADRATMDSHGLYGTPGKLQELWPISWDISYLKPKSRRRDLIKAAALIVAEIDRLDRAAIPRTEAGPANAEGGGA